MLEIVGVTGGVLMIDELRLSVRPHHRFPVPAMFKLCLVGGICG
jgi:hypothetical protein